MSADVERVMAFLADLDELTDKHGIAIGGCGCCGSPYLYDIETDDEIGFEDLTRFYSNRYRVYGDEKFDYIKVTRDGIVDDD